MLGIIKIDLNLRGISEKKKKKGLFLLIKLPINGRERKRGIEYDAVASKNGRENVQSNPGAESM